MNPLAIIAAEINAAWIACLDGAGIQVAKCPSNEEVAKIIERYLSEVNFPQTKE